MKLDELIEKLQELSEQGHGDKIVVDCTTYPIENVYLVKGEGVRIV